jgi:hypothetical protein
VLRRQLRHGAEGWVARLTAIRLKSKTTLISGKFLLQARALAAASVRGVTTQLAHELSSWFLVKKSYWWAVSTVSHAAVLA